MTAFDREETESGICHVEIYSPYCNDLLTTKIMHVKSTATENSFHELPENSMHE